MSRLAQQLSKLLDKVRVASVTCTAWGDTGKGKIVDLLAQHFDIIARGTGGANAGHTIKVRDKTVVTHLIPSGVFHDRKTIVIGSGVAFDPQLFCAEASDLQDTGAHLQNLKISHRAHLVLPHHIAIDCISDAVKGTEIGTTHRGIGPVYTNHVARTGLTANDLLNKDEFVRKLRVSLGSARRFLSAFSQKIVREVMTSERLAKGTYYANGDQIFDESSIVDRYMAFGQEIEMYVEDTDEFMRNALHKNMRVLLEGSQGILLDLDHGTYPYVTSTNTGPEGLARGAGLERRDIDLELSIVKLYMTRVGKGPFPTELGGTESAQHCEKFTREQEREFFSSVSVNDKDPLKQGIALRIKGGEYGATTGRSRRIGGLDLALLRYALRFSGPNLVITRADVLDENDTIPIYNGYIYRGPDYRVGDQMLSKGDRLSMAIPDPFVLDHCTPIPVRIKGWKRPIGYSRSLSDLPQELKWIATRFLKAETGAQGCVISIGPEREQTIVL